MLQAGIQKADVLQRLQKDIMALQGLGRTSGHSARIDLGMINSSFPDQVFPAAAVHEWLADSQEARAATGGFITGLLGALMGNNGAAVWISSERMVFPPALRHFGIEPDRIIFMELRREKDMLWALEEALKCGALSAAVCELRALDFTASRRLQLAVEQSKVTAMIMRTSTQQLASTACTARWQVTPAPSMAEDGLPGIGFPSWNVQLLKIRNGRPGSWQVQWKEGRMVPVDQPVQLSEQQTKTA